ncbi:TMEM164 family acyltransferase [Liberiplasma polymorphum]|uniref:TMEM164 family acyltransferase n=1 Tax=Liberiplasma polymorphum TaxID=3374570 RepID=UPI0037731CD6
MLYFNFMNPYIIYLIYNFITLFTIYLVFKKKTFIVRYKKLIWIFITIILIYTQFTRYIYPLIMGTFTTQESLPFFICRISALALLYYMFYPNKRLHPLLFFWGSTGIFAVFFPNGNIENIALLNETFFIDHYILAGTPFFLIRIQGYKPTYKQVNYATVAFGIVLVGFIPFNNYLQADYFYLTNQAVLHVLLPGLTSFWFAIIHTIAVYIVFNAYYFMTLKYQLRQKEESVII